MTWSHLDRYRNEILYTQIKYSKPFFIADHKRSRLYDSKTPKSDQRWPDVIVGVNCKPVTPARKKLSSKRNETLVKGTDIAYFIWNLTSLLQFCTMRAPHNSLKKNGPMVLQSGEIKNLLFCYQPYIVHNYRLQISRILISREKREILRHFSRETRKSEKFFLY